MSATDVSTINDALGRFAGGTIFALDEDSDLAGLVVPIYQVIVDAAFAAYDWIWARRTRACSLLVETPENGWSKAHSFPAGLVGMPIAVLANPRLPDQPLRAFAIEGRTVYCDVTPVWATGIFRMPPAEWPPGFRDAVTTWLAAEFIVPVTHDIDFAARMRADAIGTPSEAMRGGRLGRAIAKEVSSGGAIANILATDPLTDAHGGGSCRTSPWYGDF